MVTMMVLFILLAGLLGAAPAGAHHSPLEGFGTSTLGGAGQPLCRVTSLADRGAGTLRECLLRGNRAVVFDVVGEILLENPLRIFGAFVTINGFSAPPPGITLRRHGLMIRALDGAHDIIVRGIRVRDATGDGFTIAWGTYNVVLDHVSVDGSGDGNIDITHGAHDVTVQWSILGRTRLGKNSLIKTQAFDAPTETNRISVHHSLFIGSNQRNPRISHFNDGSRRATDVTTDFRNNIVANWRGGIGSDVECGALANVADNLYSSPGSPANDQEQAVIVRADGEADCILGGIAWVAGNVSATPLAVDINTNPVYVRSPMPGPFPAAPVATRTACEAAISVAGEAGYRPLDAVDRELTSVLSLGPCGKVPPPDEVATGDVGTRPPADAGSDDGTTGPSSGDGGISATGGMTAKPNLPDLIVQTASAPSETKADTLFLVSDLIGNIGTSNAGPFKIGIFMSSDATVDKSDFVLKERVLENGLLADGASAGGTLVKINRMGTWWLGVCADWKGTVGEANEANNCLAIGTIVVK